MNGKLLEADPAAVFGPAAGVAWVSVGDEVVVYRVADAASLVLNPTAGVLWQCLDNTSRFADILDRALDMVGKRSELQKTPIDEPAYQESLAKALKGR